MNNDRQKTKIVHARPEEVSGRRAVAPRASLKENQSAGLPQQARSPAGPRRITEEARQEETAAIQKRRLEHIRRALVIDSAFFRSTFYMICGIAVDHWLAWFLLIVLTIFELSRAFLFGEW